MRIEEVTSSTADLVSGLGEVFAILDETTQDSGNVSFGVADRTGRRWFVKTSAGGADAGARSRTERHAALLLSARIQADVEHPALVPLHRVVRTVDGIALLYDWFDGELLRSPAELRGHPDTPGARFRALPRHLIDAALGSVIDLHVALEAAGWVAGDFYDGSLMYDFSSGRMRVIDPEAYHAGSFVNTVGRLAGSTRFMAPEEHRLGATIDARTNVFNLGRMLAILHPDAEGLQLASVVARATAPRLADRFETVQQFSGAMSEWSNVGL